MRTIKNLAFIVALSLLPLFSLAQHPKIPVNGNGSGTMNSAVSSGVIVAPLQQVAKLENVEQPLLRKLTRLESENESDHPELLERIKVEKTMLKFGSVQKNSQDDEDAKTNDTPIIGSNFIGNIHNGYTPPDNTVAVSNGGWVLSCTNSAIYVYNSSGISFVASDFDSFFNDASLTATLYDPVVLYDSGADRFVMIVLHGTSSSESKVLVCFSQTNDPGGNWWVYHLTGNPLNDGSWFDYPKVGVSNNEIYVTGNLFDDNSSFNQSVIYQINKTQGYQGQSMSWQFWSGISGNPFTLLPASYGQQGNYGPGLYFVSSVSSGSNQVTLLDLTDDMGGSPVINTYPVSVTSYSPGGLAAQSGSSDLLDNGDCRLLSGFYLNGTIHYVFHTDASSGWNGIRYNRMNVSTLANTSTTFSFIGSYDYCYPSVASFGSSATDRSAMIAFERSGSSIFPECRVVHVDDLMNFSSSVQVKGGESYVDIVGSTERWGDYSGISRKQNAPSPTAWMSGCYGTIFNDWNTWIAEVTDVGVGNQPVAEENGTHFSVSPNPVYDIFTIEFNIEQKGLLEIGLYDLNGKRVMNLFEGNGKKGMNRFEFNKGALSDGIYMLSVKSSGKVLKNEKIIVTR